MSRVKTDEPIDLVSDGTQDPSAERGTSEGQICQTCLRCSPAQLPRRQVIFIIRVAKPASPVASLHRDDHDEWHSSTNLRVCCKDPLGLQYTRRCVEDCCLLQIPHFSGSNLKSNLKTFIKNKHVKRFSIESRYRDV